VASRGEIVDLAVLRDVADKSRPAGRARPLFETGVADAALQALEPPALAHLVASDGLRAPAADALSEVRFSQALWDELLALEREDGPRYQAFAALIAPRSYRQKAFDTRGAVDQLVDEADASHFDTRAVRLLIHCLRGNTSAPGKLVVARQPRGFRPPGNHHGLGREA